jgi:aminopeptidase N
MVRDGGDPGGAWTDGIEAVLRDDTIDPAFRALCLRMPSEDDLALALHEAGTVPDPDRIHASVETARRAVAERAETTLSRLFDAMESAGTFSPDAAQAGRRSLRLACLTLLTRLDGGARAAALHAGANNMTESIGALSLLLDAGRGAAELAAFHERWKGNRLVIDKWFGLQAMAGNPAGAADRAALLAAHPDFDWKNPNRFRALLGGLAANHAGFHRADGAGYRFYADWLIRLDPVNPQTTARMSTAFETWARYDAGRRSRAQAELQRILAAPGLSRDVTEMVSRILG